MKKLAILQSNYIPWKGYFDLINSVDEFVFYDAMQYTKRDWRNRNKIKTKDGIQWLTIPVKVKDKYFQKINEVEVIDKNWAKEHWKAIVHNYSRAKYFNSYKDIFQNIYLNMDLDKLFEINLAFIKEICKILNIKTKLSFSSDYELIGDKIQRLINICQQAKATHYITGPKSKNYINEQLFKEANVKLTYFDYTNYPVYKQLWGDFVHEVSILDLLFNEGENAVKYMKTFKVLEHIGV